MSGFYKEEALWGTPAEALELARLQVELLHKECEAAAGKFVHAWDPIAMAFEKAALDLSLAERALPVLGDLPGPLEHQAISWVVRRPARMRDQLGKAVRAANAAARLRSAAARAAMLGYVDTHEALISSAYDLESITFPRMSGHHWVRTASKTPTTVDSPTRPG